MAKQCSVFCSVFCIEICVRDRVEVQTLKHELWLNHCSSFVSEVKETVFML